jgi:hypothetical protein
MVPRSEPICFRCVCVVAVVLMILLFPASASGQVAAPSPPAAPPPPATAPSNQTQGASVFLAALRAQNHVKYSSSERFQEAVDEVEKFLSSSGVQLRKDPLRGKFRVEGTMSKENEIRIAQDAGATYLLQLIVERPQTAWMALTMQCFDLQGTMLWEEKGRAANQLTAAGHVQKTVKKLVAKLTPRLGSACLPVSASTKSNPTQDKDKN